MVPKLMIPAISSIIAVFQIIAISSIIAVSASPYEASGVVLKVVDGGTFEVQGLGRVRLADVDSPRMGTIEGVHAKEYALENLLGVQVFLDLDDNMRKKSNSEIPCVAYLAHRNGTPNLSKNFNKMMVQSGYASLRDDTRNEFDPSHW